MSVHQSGFLMSLDKLDKIIAVLSSFTGRDRIAKVFHYGARIAIWYYASKGLNTRVNDVERFRQTIGENRRVGVCYFI